MNGIRLQDRLSWGMGAAARVIGLPHDLFRPKGTADPLASERLVMRLPAAFDGGGVGYARPPGYGRALRGVFDADCTEVGDYLVGPRGVLFIAGKPALLRPLCVLTNAVVSVSRAEGAGLPGLNGYGGVRAAAMRVVLSRWPAEVSGGGDGGGGAIADDGGRSRWTVLLPLTGVAVEASDLIEDGAGARYVVRTAERSEFGWRLSVRRAGV